MSIPVIVLPSERRVDKGVQPPELSQFQETLSSKLSNAELSDADWPRLIDGKKLRGDPKLKINNEACDIYCGRIDDTARALYVVRNKCVVVVGILWNHDYDHPYLQGETKEISVPHELFMSPVKTDDEAAAMTAAPAKQKRVELGRHPLTRKQDDIFERAKRESVIVYGPAGAGKTELIVQGAEYNNRLGIETLYISPSSSLCRYVRSALPSENFPHIQMRTTAQIEAWINERLGRLLLEDFNVKGHAADFCFFVQWFVKTFCDRSADYNPRKEKISQLNPREVYEIIINHIIKLNARGEVCCFDNDKIPERMREYIRDITHAYFAYVVAYVDKEDRSKRFEPHLRFYEIFQALQKLQPDELARLKIGYLAVDEIQRVHSHALRIVRLLLREEGHYFYCGDPYQNLSEYQLPLEEKFRALAVPSLNLHLLDTSFRCSQSVGRFSNLLLALQQKIHGSIGGRSETFGFSVYENAPIGDIRYLQNTDTTRSAIVDAYAEKPTPTLVLIPDGASLEEAQRQWPNMTVLPISAAVGLEVDHVILPGFGEAFLENLRQLSKYSDAVSELIAAPVNFGRPHRHEEIPENIRQLRIALLTIYCGVTRARLHVTFADQRLHPELSRIISAVNASLQPARQQAVPSAAAAAAAAALSSEDEQKSRLLTLEKLLDHAYSLIEHDEKTTQQAGFVVLKQKAIWGDHTALAERWLEEQSSLNPENLIAEIKIILQSENIQAELNKRIKNKTAPDFEILIRDMTAEYKLLALTTSGTINSGKKLQSVLRTEEALRTFILKYLERNIMLADAAFLYATLALNLFAIDNTKGYAPSCSEHYPRDFRGENPDEWSPSRWSRFSKILYDTFDSNTDSSLVTLIDLKRSAQPDHNERLKQKVVVGILQILLLHCSKKQDEAITLLNSLFEIPDKKILQEMNDFHNVTILCGAHLCQKQNWQAAFDLTEKLLTLLREKIDDNKILHIKCIYFWAACQINSDNQAKLITIVSNINDILRLRPENPATIIVLRYLLIKILCVRSKLITKIIIENLEQLGRDLQSNIVEMNRLSREFLGRIFCSEMKQKLIPYFLQCYEACEELDDPIFSPARTKNIFDSLFFGSKEREDQFQSEDRLHNAFIRKFKTLVVKISHPEIIKNDSIRKMLHEYIVVVDSRKIRDAVPILLGLLEKINQSLFTALRFELGDIYLSPFVLARYIEKRIKECAPVSEEAGVFKKYQNELSVILRLTDWRDAFVRLSGSKTSDALATKINQEFSCVLGIEGSVDEIEREEFIHTAEGSIEAAFKLRFLLLSLMKLNEAGGVGCNRWSTQRNFDRLTCVNNIISKKHGVQLVDPIFDGDVIALPAAASRLRPALFNLLGNALDLTPQSAATQLRTY